MLKQRDGIWFFEKPKSSVLEILSGAIVLFIVVGLIFTWASIQ